MTYKWRAGDKPGVGWHTGKPGDWDPSYSFVVEKRPDGYQVTGVSTNVRTGVTKPIWRWRPFRET